MRVLVVGAGSTGGYFGGRLAAAGREVSFLVRPARAKRLGSDKLRIISPHGNFEIEPTLIIQSELRETFDVILLAVKATALEAALNDVAPAVNRDTMILPVLNGIRHFDILAKRFSAGNVIGCVCKIAGSVDEDGRIIQHSKLHDLAYGERNGETSHRIERLDAIMQGAGFEARLSSNIEREIWEKWILMATIGGATCLMRGNIGDIAVAPGGKEFSRRLLDESVATVTASGLNPSSQFLKETETILATESSTMTTSMYRDLIGGNSLEADQIIGDLVERARQHQISVPLLLAVYTCLSIYQSKHTPR